MASASSLASAVDDIVSSVLFRQRPSHIVGSVVMMVSVLMRDLVFARWSGAMKDGANDDVNGHAASGAEISPVIFSAPPRMQHDTGIEMLVAVAVDDPPVQRPNAPKARRFVAWVSRHWPPFFDFWYGRFSHVALPKRFGEGLTTGGYLSSVPLYDCHVMAATGITLLAARV